MNATAPAPAPARRKRVEPNGSFIYGWLLAALFLEYARPASFFPFLDIPSLYSIFPLLLFTVSLFTPGLRSAPEAFSDRHAKWIFGLLGVVFLSMLVFWQYAIAVFTSVLGYVLLFAVIARVCTTWERIRGVCKALIFAHLFLLAMNPVVLLEPGVRHYILGATFLGDGNDFGLSLCLLFPCAMWLAQTSPSKFGKLSSYACVVLMLYAIVASQSRGATLGIGAVMFFLWWMSSKKGLGVVVISLACVAVLAFAPAAYFDRIGSISDPTEGSAQGRIDAWKAGIGMGAKSPIVGVGAGHFGPRWGKTAHSTYVLAFGELGVPGLVCVLAIVIGNMRANMNLRKRILAAHTPQPGPEPPKVDPRTEASARALLMLTTAMIGFAVAGAFLSATYYPHLYVLTGLLIAARAVASRQSGIAADDPAKSRGRRRRSTPAVADPNYSGRRSTSRLP